MEILDITSGLDDHLKIKKDIQIMYPKNGLPFQNEI